MLSINEAIAREREMAERNLILLDFDELVQKSYDTYLCAEYHEQLVMCLEELKVIKEMDLSIPQHFTKEQSDWIKKYCINRNKEFYNKALDDFVKFANTMPTVEEDDGTIRPMWLEEMAEKLKGKYNEQRNNNR